LAEFGGGNSCFHNAILQNCDIKSYTIYDNNDIGIEKFKKKYGLDGISKAKKCDLLNSEILEKNKYDIVISIGLIEHFDKKGTNLVVKKHFDAVKSGGIVIITAPTPTFLYNIIRKSAEILGIWKFYDERPLESKEMKDCVKEFGEILSEKILWSTGLTQYAMVVKANA
jgi:cyclopropane fatty-acyl-phospholipid synthase-like methyltransferase